MVGHKEGDDCKHRITPVFLKSIICCIRRILRTQYVFECGCFSKDCRLAHQENKHKEAFSRRGHTGLILSVTQLRCATYNHWFILNSELSMNCTQNLHLSLIKRHLFVKRNVSRLILTDLSLKQEWWCWFYVTFTPSTLEINIKPRRFYGRWDLV